MWFAAAVLSVLPSPPEAPRIPFTVSSPYGGRTDYYYWLRNVEDPEVLEYLREENAYAEAFFTEGEDLRPTLYREMASRLPTEDVSVPWEMDGWWYGTRYEAGADYPVYFRRMGAPDGPEQVLFDLNDLAEGRGYLSLEGMSVSPDGLVAALCLDTLGDHRGFIVFLDTGTGGFLPDTLHDTSSDMAWGSDSRTFLYGFQDETRRTAGFARHVLGLPGSPDTVFIEPDSTFWPWMYETAGRKWIVLASESSETSHVMLLPSDDPGALPRDAVPREEGVLCSIAFAGDSLYLLTNRNAENFRLLRTAPFSNEEPAEVLPNHPEVLLESIHGFRDYLVLMDRAGSGQGMRILRVPGGGWTRVRLPEEPAAVYPSFNRVFESETFRFEFSSMVTPWSTMVCTLSTGEPEFLKTDSVAGYDPSLYRTEFIEAQAPDGEMVPVSLVYRADTFVPGGNPLLLYGYGAYGYSCDPSFSSQVLSLLDRGFVYAVAHVRGGQERGRRWYLEGRLLHKRNTFTDFIACGEHLISGGYCDPNRLFAMGESAGGLLIGAVANLRPDLWRGLVAGVPFVDVATTMLDETIPLTTNEYSEWGNPASREYYDYILSYSPYDNVSPVEYPAMMVTAGLYDSQVCYWEPAKWVAALRRTGTGHEPLLLVTNMEAGHGGSSGRFSWLEDLAAQYAFLIRLAGSGSPEGFQDAHVEGMDISTPE